VRICVVCNDYKQQFPLLEYGGIEAAFESLCLGLHKYFADKVKFCAIVPKILDKRDISYDFNIVETDYIESAKSGIPATIFAQRAKEIIKNSSIKPDIIWSSGSWSAQVFQDLNIPTIVTIMDSGGWEDNKFVYNKNIHYRFASKFIYDLVFQDADKNEFISKVKDQSFWLHTGISDEEYDLQTKKENYILWVAGLNWGPTNKGLDIFINLAKQRPDQTFVAYGAGNDHLADQLKQISKELKNFNFFGPLRRGTEHKNVFKKAKLFTFLTQIPEAFGRTGLEAITKGTPVLGSTKGAVPELYAPAGRCTDNISEMIDTLDVTFDSNTVYEYSQNFHIKKEIEKLLEKSKQILL
jgi:glycosyltransferase involved in cell wall biosynthesis